MLKTKTNGAKTHCQNQKDDNRLKFRKSPDCLLLSYKGEVVSKEWARAIKCSVTHRIKASLRKFSKVKEDKWTEQEGTWKWQVQIL